MTQKIFITIIIGFIISSCQERKDSAFDSTNTEKPKWNIETLNQRALQHLDSSKWDKQLLMQDIETYNTYSEIFQSYPLNKTPFPVAEYDYVVSPYSFHYNRGWKYF